MSLKLAKPTQLPESRQVLTDFGRTQAESERTEMCPTHDPMIIHRLRTATGHLESTLTAFETGQPSEKMLHQLGAVEAAIRQVRLAIVKIEMLQNLNILRASGCDEERRTATQHILDLYERFCRLSWIR
jgi:DNA-binding FrmR family transcriptional regulator